MPFFLLTDIDGLISDALFRELSKSEAALFVKIEPRVIELIKSEAQLVEPDDAADAPKWVVQPAAWIVAYLGDNLISGKSEKYSDKIAADYNRALAMLRERRPVKSSSKSSGLGKIEGLYEDF